MPASGATRDGGAVNVPNRDPDTGVLSQLVRNPGNEDVLPDVQVRERRWQWARPQVEGKGPCPRGGHTATLVQTAKSSAKLYLFGGHYDAGQTKDAHGGGGGYVYLNDTFVLDIDENVWRQPKCRGTPPEARYGHSASLVGDRIVYFGGKGNGKNFRDLHALDANSQTWFQGPSSGGAPSPRHGHTATLQGTRLFVFGGACGAKFFGDLHCLDLSSMAWSAPHTHGPNPTARYSHTALLIGESLLIHGGFCMETADIAAKNNSGQLLKACYRDDVRVLDLNRMLWSRLRTHGQPPAGRFGHSMALSEDDAVLFGGWAGTHRENPGVAFALKEKTRILPDDAETKQAQRKEDETCDYCLTLRTADMQWVKNRYIGVPPSKRYGHTATAVGPHLIIIGGWDGGKPLGDVVVLRDRTVTDRADDATDFDAPPPQGFDPSAAAAAFDDDEDYDEGEIEGS